MHELKLSVLHCNAECLLFTFFWLRGYRSLFIGFLKRIEKDFDDNLTDCLSIKHFYFSSFYKLSTLFQKCKIVLN